MSYLCVVRERYWFSCEDAGRTLTKLGALWDAAVSGLPQEVLDAAGADDLAGHAAASLADAVGVGVAGARGPREVLGRIGAAAEESRLHHDDFAAAGLLDAGWAPLLDLSEALRSAGAFTTQEGTLEQVSASGGGVPKLAQPSGEIGWQGLTTDQQAVRRHHGRPWQALCLWSADVIDELRAEGHPVTPGSAGENLALRGIDWAQVRPGTRVRVGEMACVVSAWAEPCSTIAGSFTGRDFRRIHADTGPHSRAYATVTAVGAVQPGDAVLVD